ncbi:hypothetical protein GE107_22560 [Cohnella sp. CFH 77786]|uniref:hypothetical protein n=1 Tax=Cohnella sp. CFH 77786 TaxID=2662265 RepID=UPI001C60EEB6|nr:hypothetical protein [Cohnella sp. CFH 77786]MBW5448827.1 hypothetical protein [Cohnella sp. CFH 77786]
MKPRYDLFALEMSMYLELFKKFWRFLALAVCVLLAAALYFLDGAAPESIFALSALLAWTVSFFFALLHSLYLGANPFLEWWLTLPAPRDRLIRAKMAAMTAVSAAVSFVLWLMAAITALRSSMLGETVTASRVLQAAAAYLAIHAVVVPLAVGFGFLVLWLYGGWRRIFIVPYLMLLCSPFALFGVIADSHERVQKWLSPDTAIVYAFIGALAAAVVWRFSVTAAADKGVRDLASFRTSEAAGKRSWSSRNTKEDRFAPRREQGRFRTLYAFERSGYRDFGSLFPVAIVRWTAVVLMAVAGFFTFGDRESMFQLTNVLFMLAFTTMASICSIGNQIESQRRRMAWWLGFPFDRRVLLAARIAAAAATVYRWAAAAWLSAAAGGAIRFALDGYSGNASEEALQIAYPILFYVILSILFGFAIQIQSYAIRSRLVSVLYVPMAAGTYLIPTAINHWLFTEEAIMGGVGARPWLLLLGIVAIGSPLAYAAFAAGAKWLHLSLTHAKESSSPLSSGASRPF